MSVVEIFKMMVPRIGMRNIKTAISVLFCFLVWQAVRLVISNLELHPLYAYISAVLAMRDTTENSLAYGRARIKGTIIGSVVALTIISASIGVNSYVYSDALKLGTDVFFLMLGLIFTLYAANALKCGGLCGIAAAVFLVCMIRHNSENRYIYALLRTVETIIGIGVSLAVNSLIFPYLKAED